MEKSINFRWCKWKQRSFKKYEEAWVGVKREIETINGGKKNEYGKNLKKIKFESDLPLSRPIKLRLLTIIISCVYSKHDKFYSKLFLDDALYEL